MLGEVISESKRSSSGCCEDMSHRGNSPWIESARHARVPSRQGVCRDPDRDATHGTSGRLQGGNPEASICVTNPAHC